MTDASTPPAGEDVPSPDRYEPPLADEAPVRRRWPLHVKIFLGLLVGAVLGIACHGIFRVPPDLASQRDVNRTGVDDRLESFAENVADPIGRIFLRLIFMVVVPLVVSALVLGVVGIGDVRKLGRVGLRTLGVTAAFSSAAVVIGLLLVNTIRPGESLAHEQRERLREEYAASSSAALERAKQAKSLKDTLLDIIPENPLQEMVGAVDGSSKGNGMLAVMFFSLAVGVAITVAGEKCFVLVRWFEGLFEVAMVIIGFAMRLAPLAVGCFVFSVTARLGWSVLATLFWFVVTVLLGLSIQLLVVYPIALAVVARYSPFPFFQRSVEAMVTALGTSSSNATLPTAMRVAQTELRLPPEIANFVLTIGATGNQNGTALYEGVVVLFLAQVFGVELTAMQQVMVVLMSILAGIGTAGVPGGSLPLIVIVMQSVGVPGEGIGIILGVDRILDMCRTVLNVTGDLAVAVCVAGWEGWTAPRSEPPGGAAGVNPRESRGRRPVH